ncbi:anti-phage BREX system Lon protease BrxL [Clostridium sp.]
MLEFDLDKKVNKYFGGRAVRKDLTKTMRQGFNVPVYVLEYLL